MPPGAARREYAAHHGTAAITRAEEVREAAVAVVTQHDSALIAA